MSKLDITVGRDMTINTGNYSSIKPNVSITIKDVDGKDFQKAYEDISNLADAMFGLETLKLAEEMQTIKAKGPVEYFEMLNNAKEVIRGQLERFSTTGSIE